MRLAAAWQPHYDQIARAAHALSWMQVLTELKQRGVRDILICCVDGLTGFPEAIEVIFPATTVQTCVVHLIRASLKVTIQVAARVGAR
jgi:putative transposase